MMTFQVVQFWTFCKISDPPIAMVHDEFKWELEYFQISQVMTDLLTPAVNKVPGFYFKGLTALANKPPNMQIFAPSKFGINRSTDLKIMAKKFWF